MIRLIDVVRVGTAFRDLMSAIRASVRFIHMPRFHHVDPTLACVVYHLGPAHRWTRQRLSQNNRVFCLKSNVKTTEGLMQRSTEVWRLRLKGGV